MMIMRVPLDKISPETDSGFRGWLDEVNLDRREPVSVAMAVEDDLVHGIVAFDGGRILYLYVAKDSRLTGTGTYMLKYIRGLLTKETMWAAVDPNNVDAICFFHKSGWRIESWFIGLDEKRYLRMTNTTSQPLEVPQVERGMAAFVATVPIFVSVGGQLY